MKQKKSFLRVNSNIKYSSYNINTRIFYIYRKIFLSILCQIKKFLIRKLYLKILINLLQ